MNAQMRHPLSDAAEMILDSIGDGVLSVDIDANITYINPAAERMTGWLRRAAVGRSHLDVLNIIDGDSRTPALNPLTAAILHNRTATLRANSVLIHSDGQEIAIEDIASPIRDHEGTVCGAVIVFRDVSAARARSLKMMHMAQHDALTGLPNRLLLNERLTQALLFSRRRRTLLAILFLDVDRFKEINDTFGHTIGDQLLRSMADRMTGCVRESDTVSRQGGDEFIVLLPEVSNIMDATVCAESLLSTLSLPHQLGKLALGVTVSIGIGIYPTDGADADTVLRHADTAMLRAKVKGGAQYMLFNEDIRERISKPPI